LALDESTHRAAGPNKGGRYTVHASLTLSNGLGAQLPNTEEAVLDVNEALKALEKADPRLAPPVTERTVKRDWEKARLILAAALR
jgi:hypothetical protein